MKGQRSLPRNSTVTEMWYGRTDHRSLLFPSHWTEFFLAIRVHKGIVLLWRLFIFSLQVIFILSYTRSKSSVVNTSPNLLLLCNFCGSQPDNKNKVYLRGLFAQKEQSQRGIWRTSIAPRINITSVNYAFQRLQRNKSNVLWLLLSENTLEINRFLREKRSQYYIIMLYVCLGNCHVPRDSWRH